jgi:hypothetical protein
MNGADWLPNFFIAGFPKAGTSSLHRWVADHPDALGSREKEACFFVDPESHVYRPESNWNAGLETYRNQFQLPESGRPKVIVESTPTYVFQAVALAQIPDLPTDARCLFMVREPADQIRSVFGYYRNNWAAIPASLTFGEYLEAVRSGSMDFGGNELARDALENARYVDFLRPWLNRLGEERMMVSTFNELRTDAPKFTKRVAEWIGLDPTFYDSYEFPRENETYVPRSRLLQRANLAFRSRLPNGRTYELLRNIYRQLNTRKGSGKLAYHDQLDSLRAEFLDANAELAEAFALDLSGWT